MCLCFPLDKPSIIQLHKNNFSENDFCRQVAIAITRIIPLRIIYVIIRKAMVRKQAWRAPNPPGANPLVAERAFPTSDYWGRAGVAPVVCRRNETGICRDFSYYRPLAPCHTSLRRPPRGPCSYQGVSTRGVGHLPASYTCKQTSFNCKLSKKLKLEVRKLQL